MDKSFFLMFQDTILKVIDQGNGVYYFIVENILGVRKYNIEEEKIH